MFSLDFFTVNGLSFAYFTISDSVSTDSLRTCNRYLLLYGLPNVCLHLLYLRSSYWIKYSNLLSTLFSLPTSCFLKGSLRSTVSYCRIHYISSYLCFLSTCFYLLYIAIMSSKYCSSCTQKRLHLSFLTLKDIRSKIYARRYTLKST